MFFYKGNFCCLGLIGFRVILHFYLVSSLPGSFFGNQFVREANYVDQEKSTAVTSPQHRLFPTSHPTQIISPFSALAMMSIAGLKLSHES